MKKNFKGIEIIHSIMKCYRNERKIRFYDANVITKFFLISSADEYSPIKPTKGTKRIRISSSSSENESESDTTKDTILKLSKKNINQKLAKVSTHKEICAKGLLNDSLKNGKNNSIQQENKNLESQNEITEFCGIKKNGRLQFLFICFVCFLKQIFLILVLLLLDRSNLKEEKEVKKHIALESYNPNVPEYHPIKDACWQNGEKLVQSLAYYNYLFLKLYLILITHLIIFIAFNYLKMIGVISF